MLTSQLLQVPPVDLTDLAAMVAAVAEADGPGAPPPSPQTVAPLLARAVRSATSTHMRRLVTAKGLGHAGGRGVGGYCAMCCGV